MIHPVLITLALRLWRDKGALAMTFLLPGFIFAIFAAIFNSASGGSLDLRVSLATQNVSGASITLIDNLRAESGLTLTTSADLTQDDIAERVRLGKDDVGLIISGDIADSESAQILILTEPSRKIAGDILAGQIRYLLSETAPEILVSEVLTLSERVTGPLTDAQERRKTAALAIIAEGGTQGETGLITIESATDADAQSGPTDPSVSYYVGATIAMFLLFSAMHGAALAIEERGTGITERLLLGPSGAFHMLLGRFIYLTLQGSVQAGIILTVAAVFFAVPVLPALPLVVALSVLTAAACAAIALLVAVLARTPIQMNTLATFLVLLFSAIGGSMVPRFMMPGWLQNLGWATPNAWTIEGFYSVLARGLGASALIMPSVILISVTLICLALASSLSHKMMRY